MYVVDSTVCCGEGRGHGPPGPTDPTHATYLFTLVYRRWTADVHTHCELTSVASDGGKCPCVIANVSKTSRKYAHVTTDRYGMVRQSESGVLAVIQVRACMCTLCMCMCITVACVSRPDHPPQSHIH